MAIPGGAPPQSRGKVISRAALTGVVVLCDLFVAVLALGWVARQGDKLSFDDRSAFLVLGIGAAAGVVITVLALLATVASLRGGGRAASSAALLLAWLRFFGIMAAATGLGVIASDNVYVAVLAILDAIIAVMIAATTRRRTAR
jgi:hypothetical protein